MLARLPLIRSRPLCLRSRFAALSLALATAISARSGAEPSKPASVQTPGGAGQPVLAVGLDAAGTLRAAVCHGTPCDHASGESLDAPPGADPTRLKLAVVPLGKARHAVHASWALRAGTWETVIVGRSSSPSPNVLFRGLTGLTEGQPGERRGAMVMISDAEADGTRRIVIGEQREDVTICGRPTILSPALVSSADLELHPAKVQRLSPAERDRAPRLDARRREPGDPGGTHGVVRAVAASSALGSPAALTDGSTETFWAENRGGDGRGEFVTFLAPPSLPLAGLELVLRPSAGAPPDAVAPSELWVASARELFLIRLPPDAWDPEGSAYSVTFPTPVTTDCLAIVTEKGARSGPDVAVTIAEVSARPLLEGAAPAQLVERLAAGGDEAEAAAVMLRSLGPKGFSAVSRNFQRLSEDAKRLALDVMDHAPCELSARVYVRALTGPHEAHRVHARARLGKCGEAAAPALLRAFARVKRRELANTLAEQLALTAPAQTIDAFVPALQHAERERREVMRIAIARASKSPAATPRVVAALTTPELGEVASIDLLRALGPHLREFREPAVSMLRRLASSGASFRTRYLLVEPAAELAGVDPNAREVLARAVRADRSPWVRAAAARAVRGRDLEAELLKALEDSDVRVREASADKLGELAADQAGAVLGRVLAKDRWPLVRAAAASAIGKLSPDGALDAQLRRALDDGAPNVRAAVVTALARRNVGEAAPTLRRRLTDSREALRVRIAAAAALGRLCDARSADALTRYARLLADPFDPSDARQIAPAALAALVRIGPPDLGRRISPLLDPRAPRAAQAAARDALARTPSCPISR